MFTLPDGGRAEGVRFHDVRTRFQVLFVDQANGFGPRERQQLVVPLQKNGVALHAFRVEVLFLQSEPLDHGAHGPVQDQDALVRQFFDRLHIRSQKNPTRCLDEVG